MLCAIVNNKYNNNNSGGNMKPEEIKSKREELKLTQVDVSRAVGVSLVSFRNWENGGGNPTPENLEKLKKVLGCK